MVEGAVGRRGGSVMSDVRQDLAAVYVQHGEAMHRMAASVLRGVGRASEAADVVHDAMVSIMASPPKDVQNWQAFLVTAVKRKALDRVSSAEVRHYGGSEHSETDRDRADDSDFADELVSDLDRQEHARHARASLSVLDERHRKAVWDTVALERPRSEVAAELGVSPARVSQMKTRALAILLEEMSREEKNDG